MKQVESHYQIKQTCNSSLLSNRNISFRVFMQCIWYFSGIKCERRVVNIHEVGMLALAQIAWLPASLSSIHSLFSAFTSVHTATRGRRAVFANSITTGWDKHFLFTDVLLSYDEIKLWTCTLKPELPSCSELQFSSLFRCSRLVNSLW